MDAHWRQKLSGAQRQGGMTFEAVKSGTVYRMEWRRGRPYQLLVYPMPRLALLANIREIWYGLYTTSVHLFLLPELNLSNSLHIYNSTCFSSCSDSVYWLSNQETGIPFRTGQKLSSTQHSVASGVMAAGTSRRSIVPNTSHVYAHV
jgi:hypothetical protein